MIPRIIGIIIAGIFLYCSYLATQDKSHIRNTEYIQTHEGREAIGEDIIVPGPDGRQIFFYFGAAIYTIWFTIKKLR